MGRRGSASRTGHCPYQINKFMGKSSPSAPADRNLALETQQILGMGPSMLASQQSLAPGYTNLNLSQLNSTLNGTPLNAGQLQQYGQNILPQVTAANNAATSATRASTAADLGTYGTQAVQSMRSMNPSQANIYDILSRQAGEGLAAGNQMTPDQVTQLNNSLRASQGARGMAYGPAASYQEAMQNSQYGDNLKTQRQAQAGNVAQLGSSLYTLPGMQSVMGTSANTGQAMSFLGSGNNNADAGNTFATMGSYGSDLFNTNYNAKASANINSANAQNSGIGNAMGLLGSGLAAYGSYAGMAAMAA